MGREIERKFLVIGDGWREGAVGRLYRQGYLSADPLRTVRVRSDGRSGFLTVKGPNRGAARDEYEYEIPLADAEEMLDRLRTGPLVEKTRYLVPHAGLVWEVDVFEGENRGLVVAEVELEGEDQPVQLPSWIGREVTGDERYYNVNLANNPFRSWKA